MTGPIAADLLRAVGESCREAGTLALDLFRPGATTAARIWSKSGGSPVTEADIGVDTFLRIRLSELLPEAAWLSEETVDDAQRLSRRFVWVVDPIDGTRAFISGIPVWGTLIGLTRNGVPVYGMMHQPFSGERFSGDGREARYEGPGGPKKLRTRPTTDLATATLMTTTPALFKGEEAEAFARVEKEVRLSRYGCDCYAYCMLAAGHVDLVIESGLKPYDIVALIPIIEGAGGIVTSWDGGSAAGGGRILAAGNKALHEAAMALLAG